MILTWSKALTTFGKLKLQNWKEIILFLQENICQ